MHVVYPKDLVGRNLLLEKEGSQRLRSRIVKALDDFEGDLARYFSRLKLFCTMNDDAIEEIFPCKELLDHVNNSQEDDLIEWKHKDITVHEGQLPMTHPSYNGSPCNITIEWENREITNEPLRIIAADDTLHCAI